MKYPRLSALCLIAALLLPVQAFAGITSLGNPQLIVTPPTTPAALLALTGCQDFSQIIDSNAGVEYIIQNCAGTYQLHQMWPPLASELQYSGSTSQYVRGDGTLATFPAGGSRSWASPSRAISSCFQISGSNDADFHYKVDVASGTLLSGTVTGTVTATSYTNSGCSTGAQVEADGQASQGAALGVLSVSQIETVSIDGTLQAGKWMKVTTANTSGTPTFTIRSVQREVTLP